MPSFYFYLAPLCSALNLYIQMPTKCLVKLKIFKTKCDLFEPSPEDIFPLLFRESGKERMRKGRDGGQGKKKREKEKKRETRM